MLNDLLEAEQTHSLFYSKSNNLSSFNNFNKKQTAQ